MKSDYCLCCGRELIHPIANFYMDWCIPCQMHIDTDAMYYGQDYFTQHGVECPYTEKVGKG